MTSDNTQGPKFLKNLKDLREQASRLGKEAAKTAKTVKGAIQSGASTSKSAIHKAKKILNNDNLSQGIQTTSKGVKMSAKVARLAQKGVGTLAGTIEKASEKMDQLGNKLKKK